MITYFTHIIHLYHPFKYILCNFPRDNGVIGISYVNLFKQLLEINLNYHINTFLVLIPKKCYVLVLIHQKPTVVGLLVQSIEHQTPFRHCKRSSEVIENNIC